jgi:hypothetical protein
VLERPLAAQISTPRALLSKPVRCNERAARLEDADDERGHDP